MKRELVEATIAEYSGRIGEVIGVTDEFVIDQQTNDAFGHLTDNPDPMHNDPEWARNTPLGGTVVYGFLQASLISRFWKEIGMPLVTTDESYMFNYGIDRMRFPESLHVGAPARATVTLLGIERKSADKVLWKYRVEIHQVGKKKPSTVADVLFCTVFY